MTDKQERITDISIYIAALQSTHRPAPDVRQTTHWFTTDEVYQAIKDIDPGAKITKDQVHNAMIAAGYQYQSRPGTHGLEFRWMLRAK